MILSVVITMKVKVYITWKLRFSLYLLGVGGNVYSAFTQQTTATSVGNGGCILGLLGAMHVDFLTYILLYPYQYAGGSKNRSVSKSLIFMNDEESCFTCALTVIGLFIGIATVALTESLHPDIGEDDADLTAREYYMYNKAGDDVNANSEGAEVADHGSLIMRKDWSVLYGGMITGIFCAFLWNLWALDLSTIRTNPSPVVKGVNSFHHLTKTELFFRLTMLVMPLLVLELISFMMK